MGDIKGFLKVKRQTSQYRQVCERIIDYKEVILPRSQEQSVEQASRCMDCGTPFCHWGCPVGNYIPEWNDLVFHNQWEKAFQLLDATNNLPEITGRLCPAPCEYACVLGINDDSVTIRENEFAIIEYAFNHGLIKPQVPKKRTGKKVAIIGSGPAGLSCAAQLNKAGHSVVVFERDDKIGGILRYGIPDFKLEKWVLDRRIKIWQKEGIEFKTNINVGVGAHGHTSLLKEFDATCLAGGSRVSRDLNIEGRNLGGICFAMDYLVQSNRRISGEIIPKDKLIDAKNKKVVVIGGGDTGADCVGVAHRQGASCVVQIEVLQRPPECRTEKEPWPRYPFILKSSSSHEEGGQRHWSILTKKFLGENGQVKKISCVRVEFETVEKVNPSIALRVDVERNRSINGLILNEVKDLNKIDKRSLASARDENVEKSFQHSQKGCSIMREIPGSEFEIEADLVILAVGFIHPEHRGLIKELGLKLDARGNVGTSQNFMTSKKGVFCAGDMHRGQSLIVWAISEGRKAAHGIDEFLMGESSLPII